MPTKNLACIESVEVRQIGLPKIREAGMFKIPDQCGFPQRLNAALEVIYGAFDIGRDIWQEVISVANPSSKQPPANPITPAACRWPSRRINRTRWKATNWNAITACFNRVAARF